MIQGTTKEFKKSADALDKFTDTMGEATTGSEPSFIGWIIFPLLMRKLIREGRIDKKVMLQVMRYTISQLALYITIAFFIVIVAFLVISMFFE